MSVASFSRGRPVYGGGSFAPNRGQVSAQGAQGYLKRELAKKPQAQGPYGGVSQVGNDGRSDTRSGVASSALSRTAAKSGTGKIEGENKPNGAYSPPAPNVPTAPSNPSAPNSPAPNTPAPPPPPQVVVSPTGQLELPYNQQFSQDVLSALDQHNSDLLQLQMDEQTQGLNYITGKRDAGIKYEELKRGTLSNNAARGTAFSSGYGLAVGRNAQGYQNQLNDMDSKNSLFNQMSNLKRSSIITAFQRMLAQGALDNANDLEEDAGDLGLGNTPPSGPAPIPTTPNIPDSVYQNIGNYQNWTVGNKPPKKKKKKKKGK